MTHPLESHSGRSMNSPHTHPIRTVLRAVFALSLFAALAAAPGCGSRGDVAPVTEWQTYDDAYSTITFRYPKGWNVNPDGRTVTITSTAAAAAKFLDPASGAPDGAQIVVSVARRDSTETAEDVIAGYAAELTAAGFTVERVTNRTLAGEAAAAVRFKGAYTADAHLRAERVCIVRDSTRCTVHVATFNAYSDAYAWLADSVLASVALAGAKTAAPGVDPALPSETVSTFSNFALSMQYPDNFETMIPSKRKGESLFSMDLRGYRQDCTIHIDILPSKGLTVDKIVEQNSKFYASTSRGETKIDGQRAIYLAYTPAKNVQSRVYFVAKGDKFARVIMNIYVPMKAAFLPAFERSIASIRIK